MPSFLSLMPSFAVIGIGGGLTVPLTASVLDAMPRAEAGVASGIFNASREVSGLLGITVIGAVLTARQSVLLTGGDTPTDAFLGGYQAGLLLAAGLVALGGVAAFIGLRHTGAGELPADVDAAGTPVAVVEAAERALAGGCPSRRTRVGADVRAHCKARCVGRWVLDLRSTLLMLAPIRSALAGS